MLIVDDFPVDRTETLFCPSPGRSPVTTEAGAAHLPSEVRGRRWALGHLLHLPALPSGSGTEVAL